MLFKATNTITHSAIARVSVREYFFKMKNWKTIKSKVVFQCPYFKIIEEYFLTSSGKKYRYHIMKRGDYVVVVAKEKNYFYLVKLYRYTTKSRAPEFVAGSVEKNETPLQAAKKELREEAGITAKKIKKIGWYYAYRGTSDHKAYIFLAEDLRFDEQELEDLEREGGMKVEKFKISEVEEMIRSGKIKDVDTIAVFNIFRLKCK